MLYHSIATLPGGRKKSLYNKTEDQTLASVVQFLSSGTISATWGNAKQTYQVLELRIYQTQKRWHKATGGTFEAFLGPNKRNLFPKFEQRAKRVLGKTAHRVFVIMPIQGEKFGTQDEQRVFQEYDQRFEQIEKVLGAFDCVAIRIDKEHPLEGLVARIKDEITKARFVVADLTDERASCYFEVGYADALAKPIIHVASKESVLNPKTPTKIHFDIHQNVHFFVNHKELREKLRAAIDKNRIRLFSERPSAAPGMTVSAGVEPAA